MNKHFIVIGTAVLLLVVGFSGCNEINNLFEEFELDPVIKRANPYINKIITNDIQLRTYANSIIKDCPSNDKECQTNSIYRHIVENFNYLSDPTGVEFIQSPQETIQIGGGDCEDLSILFNSLLENVGIKTYLVLSETHAYSLVYDVDITNLWKYVEQSFIKLTEDEYGDNLRQTYEQSFTLEGNHYWYYGGDGKDFGDYDIDYMNITYVITSTKALDFYVVPTQEDYNKFVDGETFMNYPDCKEENILSLSDVCSNLGSYGGIILSNKNWVDADVDVKLEFYLHPSFYNSFKDNTITYYWLEGKKCIVVDCTSGKWGYPGYDTGIIGKKTAIDPITKEYTYLT